MNTRIPSGDLGFDVLLGGGFNLVERVPKMRSATIVVRGGAGVGKTLVGLDIGYAVATALGRDLLVGAVEILPTEYAAQVESARPDLADRVRLLPAELDAPAPVAAPSIYCGLLADLEPESLDLVRSIESLLADASAAGCRAGVLVVD